MSAVRNCVLWWVLEAVVVAISVQLTQNEIFVDTTNMHVIKKQVKPIDQQLDYESRR